MNMIQESFKGLYNKDLDYNTKIVYSNKFKPYNANASKSITTITVKLSRKWKSISKDIRIGLIQSLLVKFFGKGENTINIDLYNNFIKNVHIAIPKEKSDPILSDSFERINEKYFNGMIEKPNLVWGSDSVRKLGSYDFQSDEISISSIFKENDIKLLDYVMYHEMLHKKHKFHNTASGRSYHHTSKFKKAEKAFENSEEIEKELTKLCRKSRIKRVFFPYRFKRGRIGLF